VKVGKKCLREHEFPIPVILSFSQSDHLASHDLEDLISVAGLRNCQAQPWHTLPQKELYWSESAKLTG